MKSLAPLILHIAEREALVCPLSHPHDAAAFEVREKTKYLDVGKLEDVLAKTSNVAWSRVSKCRTHTLYSHYTLVLRRYPAGKHAQLISVWAWWQVARACFRRSSQCLCRKDIPCGYLERMGRVDTHSRSLIAYFEHVGNHFRRIGSNCAEGLALQCIAPTIGRFDAVVKHSISCSVVGSLMTRAARMISRTELTVFWLLLPMIWRRRAP